MKLKGAAALRVGLPDPYVYKSAMKRVAARGLDGVGQLLLARPRFKVDWSAQKKVAVLRLDHLGDLLHALPTLRRLRLALPQARLDLWVGPWGRELAGLFTDVDRVQVTAAPWFERPARQSWPWSQLNSLARELRAQEYDAAFELRGDLRHHLALWRAGMGVRAGHALTAGGFLLTHPAVWNAALHEQAQGLALLDQAAVPMAGQGGKPYLSLPLKAKQEAAQVTKALGLKARPIMVQAACGTQAKRWSVEAWAKVLVGLPSSASVVLLGSAAEREEMLAISKRVRRKVAVAAGHLSLSGLAAFVANARLLLSVDSGPAHLAAVQGVPVLSLFSGTNRALQWAPRGPRNNGLILQAQDIPCSPCELSDCPYGNACMNAIEPAAVLLGVRKLLRAA